jgi:predicted glycoside hydrolase/deacetylase ChbG (UPF0249 family)
MIRLVALFITALLVARAAGQTRPKSFNQALGYPPDAKLLIVHADDLGMTHSVNAASIQALQSGLVNSGSMMVPTPWFPEIADFARNHPDVDLGLHLTLTSERIYFRWGPVAPANRVPSLIDSAGYFFHDWESGPHIDAAEAELEIRAQIDKALTIGLHPTHLDSHQYRLIATSKDLFAAFVRVAHDYNLPFFVARDWFTQHAYLEPGLTASDIIIAHTVTIEPSVKPEAWADFYLQALRNLQPGVTEFVIHPAFDNDEMRAATRERDTWGAAWRQRDFDFFTSSQFRNLLRDKNIHLITWRELAHAHAQPTLNK